MEFDLNGYISKNKRLLFDIINSYKYQCEKVDIPNDITNTRIKNWQDEFDNIWGAAPMKIQGCEYYHDNHCCVVNESEDECKKLREELKIAQSDIQSLKNMIVKMCYDRYGE